jgi:hypothetical protein
MFRLLSLFIRQFRYFGGLVKHAPSIVALEGVCLLLGSLLALWVRPRERRIPIEVFCIVFESRLRHLGTCPFKASAPEQEEFLRDFTSPSLFGRPKTQTAFSQGPAIQVCALALDFTNERWRCANGQSFNPKSTPRHCQQRELPHQIS